MGVKVGASPAFSPDRPRALFHTTSEISASAAVGSNAWDVAPDGRFLMIEELASAEITRPVTVVLNWLQELQSRSSAR